MRAAYTKGQHIFQFCTLNMKNSTDIVIETMFQVIIERKLNYTGQCLDKQLVFDLDVSEDLFIFTYVSFELTRIIASMLLTMDIVLVAITTQPMYPAQLLDQTKFIFGFETSFEAEIHLTGITNLKKDYNMTYVGFLYLKEFDEDEQNFEKPCSDRESSAFCLYADLDKEHHENCYREILVDYRDPVSVNKTMNLIWQDPNLRVVVLYGSGFTVHKFTTNPIVRPHYDEQKIFMVPFERSLTSQIQSLSNLGPEMDRFDLGLLRNVPGEHSINEFLRYCYYLVDNFATNKQFFSGLLSMKAFLDNVRLYQSLIPGYKKGDSFTYEMWTTIPLQTRKLIGKLFISDKANLKHLIQYWKKANYKYLIPAERLLSLPWFNPKQAIKAKPFCDLKIPNCTPGKYLTHSFYKQKNWKNSYGWNCQKCSPKTFKDVTGNFECKSCRYPNITNNERTQCYDPYQNVYLKVESHVLVVIPSLVGMVLILVVAALFWNYRETPIVKHANRPITILQLASHFALAASSLVLFFRMPTRLSCTLRSFIVGIFFTLTVSINLGKTQKLLLIFNSKNRHTESEKRLIGILEWLISGFFIIIDVAIFVVSIVNHPPEVKHILKEDADEYIRDITCSNNAHILIQLSFVLILVLAKGVQALRSRKLPSHYKETTHVIYSSFISVIVLLSM